MDNRLRHYNGGGCRTLHINYENTRVVNSLLFPDDARILENGGQSPQKTGCVQQ